jgi:hypothetical protein
VSILNYPPAPFRLAGRVHSALEQAGQVGDAVEDRVRLGLGARPRAVALAAADQHRGRATAWPPPMSAAGSSPTTSAVDAPPPSAPSGAVKNSGDGLPSTRAVSPVAYSSSRTHPPVSRHSPSSSRATRLTWVGTSSAPARTARKAASRSA